MDYKNIKHKAIFSSGISGILLNPHYFENKCLVKSIQKYAPILNGKLLDFGCGSKPYESLFSNVQEYIGLDYKNDGHNHSNESVDVFYNGKEIPFEDETFDSVLSTQVFEHVEDIEFTIRELHRVLKKDGKILITAPFIFPEHELPHDYRRLTSTGLISLLQRHGFKAIEVNKNGNFKEVVWQLRIIYIRDLIRLKNKYLNILLRSLIIPPMVILGIIFSAIFPARHGIYFGTTVLAKK